MFFNALILIFFILIIKFLYMYMYLTSKNVLGQSYKEG